jgi:hypothetical protein
LFTGLLPRLASYRILPATRVQIEGPPGEPVQADGDIIATLPTRIEVLPEALELVFPPARGAPELIAAQAADRGRAAERTGLQPAAAELQE